MHAREGFHRQKWGVRLLASGVACLLIVAVLIPSASQAQNASISDLFRCDTVSTGRGTIRGRIVNDSTGAAIGTRGVHLAHLDRIRCMAVTDESGRFQISNVPPGEWHLAVGTLGYRHFEPLPVRVTAGATVEVEVRLRPGNLVEDCLEISRCREVLVSRAGGGVELSDTERLELAVLRTSVALAGGRWGSEVEWMACVRKATPSIIEKLKKYYPLAVPDSECGMSDPDPVFKGSLIHKSSGRPARAISIGRVEQEEMQATTQSSYYVGPSHAQGWECRFKKADGDWVAEWCGTTWIS